MNADRYLPAANMVARLIPETLTQRGLEPVISRFVLTETSQGAAWLFAVLDVGRIQKLESYISRDTLHQISTALRGRPVVLSNSTGLRYAILLSQPPSLPKKLAFPGWRAGMLQVGQGSNGQAVTTRWEKLGHILVAGMTNSGKSTFLRLLATQAIQEGFSLALADPDGRTFPQISGHPGLFAPLAQTMAGCQTMVDAVLAEITLRSQLYAEAEGYPDSLEAYNATPGTKPLPRLLVIIDEFNGLVMATGGPKAALAQSVTQIAWRGRKFGITLVLAGQDFTKELVGAVREQMTTRICFQVASPSTSRIVLGRGGAERIKTPGRAWSNLWGLIQTYYAELTASPTGDGLTPAERKLAERLIEEFGGRMSYDALSRMGIGRRQAERLRADWSQRGLAEVRPGEDNALCVSTARFSVQTGLPARAVQTEQTDSEE